jgi:hypothetical protein
MILENLNQMEQAAISTLKKYETQIKFAEGKTGWQYHNQEQDKSLVIQSIRQQEQSDEIEQALDTLIAGMYNRTGRSYTSDLVDDRRKKIQHQGLGHSEESVDHIVVSNKLSVVRVHLDSGKPNETFHLAEELAKVLANNGVNFPGSSKFLEPAKSA